MPSPKSKKRNVTKACTECRRRKVKCDGNLPTCSNCIRNAQGCCYQDGEDKRSLYSRRTIAGLVSRINELEQELTLHGIPVPSQSTLSDIAAQSAFCPSLEDEQQVPGLPGQDQAGFSSTTNTSPNDVPIITTISHSLEKAPHDKCIDPSSSIVSELACRLGTLQLGEDGHLRYFGATSNFHVLSDNPMPVYTISNNLSRWDQNVLFAYAEVGQEVSDELERHFLKLFFTWAEPLLGVVQQAAYFKDRNNHRAGWKDGSFYSDVLTNAMCAYGAALSDVRVDGVDGSTVEFFAKRARILLDAELDQPRAATVQALVIMSAVEAMFTRDSRGWLYCGMAVSLAFDLGLHLDVSSYVKSGEISQAEAEQRYHAFWSTYITERMWRVYVGRHCAIHDSDITTPRPFHAMSSPEDELWMNHSDPGDSVGICLQSLSKTVNEAMISFCDKMGRISRTLYANAEISYYDRLMFSLKMQTELELWQQNHNPLLHVHLDDKASTYLPYVLELHAQFHELVILNNRPFLIDHTDAVSDPLGQRRDTAHRLCAHAASSIARLLQFHRRLYTLRRANLHMVHIVFTAALILAYIDCTKTSDPGDEVASQLQICTQALGDMSQSYKSASRALEAIMVAKSRWYGQMRQVKAKRMREKCESHYEKSDRLSKRRPSGSIALDLCPTEVDLMAFSTDDQFTQGWDIPATAHFGQDALWMENILGARPVHLDLAAPGLGEHWLPETRT